MMNLAVYETLFQLFKQYVNAHSEIPIKVLKKPNTQDFPKVVLTEITNIAASNSRYLMESYSVVGYEIDIYAIDLVVDGVSNDSMEVARYIESLVADFMEHEIGLKRVMAQPSPNIDDTIYRITMRYNGNISDYRGHFF